jgi:glycosyltransferase involved in cell wall biosynthesis
MAKHRIDVLMSVFNGSRTVEQTIESIRGQTIKDIRIIVVNDGSTDDTKGILDRIAEQDERLLILSKPNTGIVDSLELGLAQCTAPFIARHDADDISYPGRFETQLAYFDAHPDCVAVSGGARYINADGHDTGRTAKIVDLAMTDENWIPAREPHLKQPFLMLQREALLAVGGYRPLHVSEDSDLYWRLRKVGRLHNMDCLFGDYRVHDDSISSGSVRSGRIIALYSQLVALSARRQIAGRADIDFQRTDYQKYSTASTLSELHKIASHQLDEQEKEHLRIAMGAKLIELCFYRNFELDLSDCVFIGRALRDLSNLMNPSNQAILSQSVMQTALRLAIVGRVYDATQLLPLRQRPILILRLAFRLSLPLTLRDRLKRLIFFRKMKSLSRVEIVDSETA